MISISPHPPLILYNNENQPQEKLLAPGKSPRSSLTASPPSSKTPSQTTLEDNYHINSRTETPPPQYTIIP